MGCTASKLDNEDTVRRCKERRRLMKEAVYARHHLASAHADYCRSLRLTGSALCSFAAGESLSVSEQTPAIFLHHSSPLPPRVPPPPSSSSAASSFRHPPPPPHPFTPSRSPSIASSKLPHILPAASPSPNPNPNHHEEEKTTTTTSRRVRGTRVMRHPKLPHILSETESELGYGYPEAYQAQSTYSGTPSQASSVWNWENFYPPSPPDSEFFERKAAGFGNQNRRNHHHNLEDEYAARESESETETETETVRSTSEYDFFNNKSSKYYNATANNSYRKTGGVVEETEREEVQTSEWGDHHDRFTTTSSSEDDAEEDEEQLHRSDSRSRSNHQHQHQTPLKNPQVMPNAYRGPPAAGIRSKSTRSDAPGSSFRTNGEEIFSENNMKMVVRHKDLKEIVEAIREYFDKAASAGDQVSEMLEIGRAQIDRSFRQLKKTVYHSSNVFSNLSATWTSKPPLAVKYRLDTGALSETGGPTSLCSTIERLLAWEKKLYEEVKAREGVKIEHEKKLSTLQSQEYKGEDDSKLDKTKASITRLQSLIIVTSQAVSATSTAISGLRDSDLVPQLVDLCHGFMYMWRSMHQYHEIQNHIVEQVRGLVNRSNKGDSTSELHKQATRDLESAVSAWHSSFCRLIKFQRDFIRSIHAWFKLTLLPINNDNVNVNMESSDVYAFFDEWKLALDRVPDTVASEAIKSFINVVHVISVKQTDELKIKKRTETASKELEKRASSLRNIERKFYNSYSTVGIRLPDSGPDNGLGLDARDPLAEKKTELAACQRRVEDEMLKHAKAVEVTRAMTLNNLQTGLPGVFQALTSFSSLFMEALELVCNRSYAIKN